MVPAEKLKGCSRIRIGAKQCKKTKTKHRCCRTGLSRVVEGAAEGSTMKRKVSFGGTNQFEMVFRLGQGS
jgi:hypothetical protein